MHGCVVLVRMLGHLGYVPVAFVLCVMCSYVCAALQD